MQKYLKATDIVDFNNKEGISTQFNPPYEQLAFKLEENEFDLSEILSEPLDEVIVALKENTYYAEMVENFPDIVV